MRKIVSSLLAVGSVALAPVALGQGVITDGTARFEWNSFSASTGTGASTDFQAGATDDMFGMGWWGRLNNTHTREFNFGVPTSQSYVGDTATHGYVDLLGIAGLTARHVGVVQEVVANTSARFRQTLLIVNNTGQDLDLSIFHYADYDVAGAASDSAAFVGTNHMRITDVNGRYAEYAGVGADAYQVTAFATLRGLLTDTDIDNLNNTGLPFGPGDFTGAYQWNLRIADGDSAVITVLHSINVVVPAPGALALLGVAGFAARRRRRD